jgi:general secretion pathway protein I
MRRAAGFTLLEVMVALAIAALALLALFGAAGATNRATLELRTRTLGHMVASNAITELRLGRSWLEPGQIDGDAELGGQRWRWRATVSPTEDAAIRRLDVTVRDADQQVAAAMTGFIARPGSAQ